MARRPSPIEYHVDVRRWFAVGAVVAAGVAAAVVTVRRCGDSPDRSAGDPSAARGSAKRLQRARKQFPAWWGQPGTQPRHIAGRVSYRGNPVEGARVRLTSEETEAGALDADVVTTSSNGAFDFGDVPAAEYNVTAMTARRTASGVRVDLRDPTGDPQPDRIELELSDCAHSLHGQVQDAAGGAIAAAKIRLKFAEAEVPLVADDSGKYEACASPGSAWLWASAEGYAQAGVWAQVFGRSRQDIELSPEVVVSGRAVAAEDGTPLSDVLVTVRAAETQGGSSGMATTDREGRFRVAGLLPGRYELTARTAGRATRRPTEAVAFVGEESDETVLRLASMLVVRGRVLEGERPVAGTRVFASSSDYEMMLDLRAVSQTDGSFVFDGVPPSEITVFVARYQTLKPDTFDISPTNKDVTIRVERMARIMGQVLRNGTPAPRAIVFAANGGDRRASIQSRHDGMFDLSGLEAGTYEIGCESDEQGAFGKAGPVTLAKGEERDGFVCNLDLASTISGSVVDGKGAAVAGVIVRFSLVGGRDLGFAATADDGSFTARSLSGGGKYAVDVGPSGESPLGYRPATGDTFQPVAVPDGNSNVTGVRIAIRYDRLRIAGRVVRKDGGPVPDVIVSAALPKTEEKFSDRFHDDSIATSMTWADGSFALRDLVAGSYTVRARTGTGIRVEVKDVKAGREELLVELPAAGTIDGALIGFSEPPDIIVYPGDGRHFRAQVKGDKFLIRDLPAAKYVLRASTASEGDTASVDLKAGVTAKITLRSSGKARVTATALDFRTRQPVADAECHWHQWSASRKEQYFAATGHERVKSDARGRFALDVPAAKPISIRCFPRDWDNEDVHAPTVNLAASATTDVEVLFVNRQREKMDRGYIGVTGSLHPPTLIEGVAPDGPAARAGLQKGDTIIEVDGVNVEQLEPSAVHMLVIDHPIGSAATIVVRRAGTTHTLKLTIGRRTDDAGRWGW